MGYRFPIDKIQRRIVVLGHLKCDFPQSGVTTLPWVIYGGSPAVGACAKFLVGISSFALCCWRDLGIGEAGCGFHHKT